MLAIDGAGFDWSYMADDEVPTNMALMAFSDSEVHNDKTCSKTCLKSFETLKTQLDDLRIEFNKSEFNLATYKRGLASVEEQLVFYKKNEVLFCEQIAVLKRDISYKDSEISELKSELEKLKQEKESNQLKIENFDNASKSLDKLIGSQIPDKSRKGLGFASYNAVPPPHTGLFAPPTLDLSNSGLEEFQQPEFEGYGPKISKSVSENVSNEVRKSPDSPLVEELVLDVDKFEKKTVFPTKIEFVKQQEKLVRKQVKYAEMYKSQGPKGNQRNWNNQKSQQLGSDFVMYNKACFVCGSFDHLQTNCNYHQRERVVSRSNYTRVNYNYSAQKAHPSAQRNMVPRAVLIKNGIRTLNTARPVNTAHPKTTVYSARPMSLNSVKGKFYTARPKAVNNARPNTTVVNAVRANQVNAVKASECWVWRPTKLKSASITFKRHNYVDARGRSKVIHNKKIKGDILLVQVYVDDIIFGSNKKVLCTEFEKLMHKKFQMSLMGELTFFLGLQVTHQDDGIFICQDKYVEEILKKFGFSTVKTASTPMETSKPLLKDAEVEDVDVHLYRSMIGSLMYLTTSRPDIMFAVCACARFQVTPKGSHLHAVKRIFRYLKGQSKLGLWYPKDSPFDLEAYTDSDYAGASLDRKSTTGEYVAAASCCGQVLRIQNQMLDYGYNFMNTKIFIDNESTICIVKNPVFHSKTKHIEIRHHFIRDSNEKKLIQIIKIHTYHNVADLLTKAFDVGRFQYLIARIGMLNL
ncbi:putative ribonuclease H-like domain-containing protein [Tanacetum coccineum]